MAEKYRQEAPATLGEAWTHGLKTGLELSEAKAAMRETISERAKLLRMAAKLTQEELARKIGINYLTYRGYENCKSDIPIVYLIRIADQFDVSLDYLTGRTDNRDGMSSGNKPQSDMADRLAQLEKAVAILTGGQETP